MISLFTEGNIRFPFNKITSKQIKSFADKVCKYLELKKITLNLILCDNEVIHAINRDYRKKDKPTDVISFSYRENPFPKISNRCEELGDIYISLEKAAEDAAVFGISLEEEIRWLEVHGILHLVGYDHEKSRKDEKIMRDKEKEILSHLV
jgi:probable rRNA maturation factor